MHHKIQHTVPIIVQVENIEVIRTDAHDSTGTELPHVLLREIPDHKPATFVGLGHEGARLPIHHNILPPQPHHSGQGLGYGGGALGLVDDRAGRGGAVGGVEHQPHLVTGLHDLHGDGQVDQAVGDYVRRDHGHGFEQAQV